MTWRCFMIIPRMASEAGARCVRRGGKISSVVGSRGVAVKGPLRRGLQHAADTTTSPCHSRELDSLDGQSYLPQRGPREC